MQVAADESLKALAMGELDVEHAAVTLRPGKGVELALVAGIVQDAEVAPVDFEALSGAGLHPHEGAGRMCGAPQLADVMLAGTVIPPSYPSGRKRCRMTTALAVGSCSSRSATVDLKGSILLVR